MKKVIASIALVALIALVPAAAAYPPVPPVAHYKPPTHLFTKVYIPPSLPQPITPPPAPIAPPRLTTEDIDRIAAHTNFTPPSNDELDLVKNMNDFINNNRLCRFVPPIPVAPLCPWPGAEPGYPIFKP